MTHEDIIRMVRESQQESFVGDSGHWFKMEIKDLERLIKLAVSEAKDAWAEQEMDNIWQAIKIEREACAAICDRVDAESQSQWPRRFATMIRARGNQ